VRGIPIGCKAIDRGFEWRIRPDVLGIFIDEGVICWQDAPGLPEFLEIGRGVVLGVLDAERDESALIPIQIGVHLGRFFEVEEFLADIVGAVDVIEWNAMSGQREEADVLEGFTHFLNESTAACRVTFGVFAQVEGRD